MTTTLSFDCQALAQAYAAGTCRPRDVVATVFERILVRGKDAVWLHLLPEAAVQTAACELERRRQAGADLPLYGLPFAVKDNIDVAGLPTTAACPEFAYIAASTAPVVEHLLAAGALLIGKTNMDQFATGLVGTRSPYGAPSCVFDPDYISGGSSSGSAVAVAAGLVSFALGSDTAGSGRVPAAFNNIVGWKPTRGLLSTRGLVPACRSLDCVSVFALSCADVQRIRAVVARYDAADPFSRAAPAHDKVLPAAFRFGVPAAADRQFFGDTAAAALYDQALAALTACGGQCVVIDYAPLRATAQLLYGGPWVAERLAAIEGFLAAHPSALLPVTAGIIRGAESLTATAVFRAFYQLADLQRRTAALWQSVDLLALPTTGTIYSHAAVQADPLGLNTNLGFYTNFTNLLDLAAVAVPAGFRPNGLPFGISLIAPAFTDAALCDLGGRLQIATASTMGATGVPVTAAADTVHLAVVGAHLAGQPLNHQLTSRGGTLVSAARTASDYRLYALAGTVPAKPGLVRDPGFVGPGIEVEIWALSLAAFGAFVNEVPAPLAIGTATLSTGMAVKCFVCEPSALANAEEITHFGGWRAYRQATDRQS